MPRDWSGFDEINKAMEKLKPHIKKGSEDYVRMIINSVVNNSHWAGRDWDK